MIVMDELMTQIGHTVIIVGVAAGYLRANQAKDLVEVQKDTIATLKVGFEECKKRLEELERTLGNNGK